MPQTENLPTVEPSTNGSGVHRLIAHGDLSKLSEEDRSRYYLEVCHSLGLNPLTKPLGFLVLKGKTVLYVFKDGTEQLRSLHGVSVYQLDRATVNGVHVVTAYARDKDGRTDCATGAVFIEMLKGEDLANAIMKAETKAKRRVTLSLCGLGFLDESEVASIPQTTTDGEIVAEARPLEQQAMTLQDAMATEPGIDLAAVSELQGLIAETGTDLAKLKAHYRVEELSRLSFGQAEEIKRILQERKAKQAKPEPTPETKPAPAFNGAERGLLVAEVDRMAFEMGIDKDAWAARLKELYGTEEGYDLTTEQLLELKGKLLAAQTAILRV